MTESSIMNPYSDENLHDGGSGSSDQCSPSSSSPSVILTGQSSLTVLHQNPALSRPSVDVLLSRSALPLPDFSPSSGFHTLLTRVQSTENPYPPLPPPQVSVSFSPSDPQTPPLQSQCSEEDCPDLECSICFSQFNNIFRCPKMLHCKHTFCLECLARMNVKSAEPSSIQCPLCRGLTPLPTLGLPRLATDSNVLSYLPAAMQRVYSIRFIRNKGKLQVKRSTDGPGRLGQRPLASLRSMNRTLDVGLPSPPSAASGAPSGGIGGALFRLTGRPACRAFLLTSVVMMMVLLTGIVIFLLSFSSRNGV